jgi:3-oxoacyl-[acyl-carrier protein] reductase
LPTATKPLADRVVVVTGCSRRMGIGYATVLRLLDMGASVFAHGWGDHDRHQGLEDDAGGSRAFDLLRAAGQTVAYAETDLALESAPATVIDEARDVFGHVDALVVNHARSGRGELHEITAAEIDAFLRENVRAALLLVQAFAAQHDGRPGGRVVLLTSGQHLDGMPEEVGYAVSKGAIQQATATLSAALSPRGITVNCINPGPTDTGWGIGAEDPAGQMPRGRWGMPDDAARLITWLCTDDADWITGQTINSEGGFLR